MWEIAGLSVCGPIREHNEDAIGWDENAGLLVLADGLGGHSAGEVASAIAVSQVMMQLRAQRASCAEPGVATLQAWLRDAAMLANAQIFALGQEDDACWGMGTTLLAAALTRQGVCLAHVGDSRAYRLHEGGLELLTRDHTQLQWQIDLGLIQEAYPGERKTRSWLMRAVGTHDAVEVDTGAHVFAKTDILMLASDGLFEPVPDRELMAVLNSKLALAAMASRLADLAIRFKSDDNISVILARQQ